MKKVRQQEAGFGSGKFPSYKKCTHPLFFVRKHECTGRPLGSMSFVERLESTLGRSLQRQKPGPKKEKGN